jgi:hypothetical protein
MLHRITEPCLPAGRDEVIATQQVTLGKAEVGIITQPQF